MKSASSQRQSQPLPTVPNSHAFTGRSDKPYSGLDVPKVWATPYKDGTGKTDLGLTPVVPSSSGDIADSIFDVDKYWPFYLTQKNWLLSNCRDVVYKDINKKKTLKTHNELRSLCLWYVVDLARPGFPIGGANPNWDDWHHETELFERVRTDEAKSSYGDPRFVYRNYFGGPTFELYGESSVGPKSGKYGLEELAKSVQEDLYVLRRTKAGWILRAAAVCFPSYWSLDENMGKPFVVGDDERALDDLDIESPVERCEWMLTPDVHLHRPSSTRTNFGPEIDDSNIAWKTFIRTDRQIFVKLRNNDILVTNRTYLNGLVTACQYRELASGLESSITNTPSAAKARRGIDMYGSKVLRYIDRMWGNSSSGCAGFHN